MAWHHHLAKVHEHLAHHTKNALVRVAEHHPILTGLVTLVGGVTIVRKFTEKPAVGTPTPTGGV